ncbi:lipase family protein [Sphingomonas bacterium]|uniref:lipase family protein n=1 Tax=Sphingomonas bacterium TaxID=1895847 RepID=UPI002608EFB4|nr:lipase family protein [Sphingomonas bacterium]MDB5679309.1 putative lipase [Sphingomonas bacterium]
MKYNPTNAALTHPESQPPLVMDARWPIDAVCAEFSRLAYFAQTGTTVADAVAPLGFGKPTFFASEDPGWWKIGSAGFGAVDRDGHAIIAFRGTQIDTPWDIIIDLGIWPRRWPGAGRVHDGFWKALRSILGQVETWLADPAIKRLTITGHSLGAAMATLLAGLKADAELVTFGSPLVGNRAFADAFAGRCVRRYVDTIDFVTTVPPVYYQHLEGLHFIDPDGIVRFPGAGPTEADVAQAIADYAPCRRDPLKNALSRRFADHAPINYVGAVLGRRTGPR